MFPKPSRTERKKGELAVRRGRELALSKAKAAVRRRDKVCRFPRCGCRRLGLRLEVAHDVHQGMGGNPLTDRNHTPNMVLLCTHRHQFGPVSFHKGTLRVMFLSRDGFDGPVKWMLNRGPESVFRELARERRPGVLEPPTDWQNRMLDVLSELEL